MLSSVSSDEADTTRILYCKMNNDKAAANLRNFPIYALDTLRKNRIIVSLAK